MESLRDRIIAAIAQADQDWCSDQPLYEDMADAVIDELGLRVEYGALDEDEGGVLADTPEEVLPLSRGETLMQRLITDWIVGDLTDSGRAK